MWNYSNMINMIKKLDCWFPLIVSLRYYAIFPLFSRTILGYQWLEYNDKFDCIVGISVKDINISIGVFISARTVITSANPLNQYLNNTNDIMIHTINESFNISQKRKVESVAGNQSFRKLSWVTVGFDATHSTIHDIALINVIEEDRVDINQNHIDRRPFASELPKPDSYILYEHQWMFAGFGYTDHLHIRQNTVLEVTYVDSALANCDEWLPREWGHFICIVDDQDLPGVASGAPLFDNYDIKTVRGIGSFAFKKDNDKILVFTNLAPYVDKLYGYLQDD